MKLLLLLFFLLTNLAACTGQSDTTPLYYNQPSTDRPALHIVLLYTPDKPWVNDVRDAVYLFLSHINHQSGPYDIHLSFVQDGGSIETAYEQADALVEQLDVHLVFGAQTEEIGGATARHLAQKGIPYMAPTLTADDLTQRGHDPRIIRTGGTASQAAHPFGHWAYHMRRARRIGIITADHVFGHESAAGFRRTFEEAGGEIVAHVLAPPEVPDFVPLLSQIPRDADALFVQLTGDDLIRALEDIALMGWSVPVLVGTASSSPPFLATFTESEPHLPGGLYVACLWPSYSDTHGFTAAFYAQFGRRPSVYAAETYAGLTILDAAIVASGRFVHAFPAFLQALHTVLVDTPKGPITMDSFNNPMQHIHIFQYSPGAEGGTVKRTVDTFPSVSQFWRYDPDEFLALPAYDRNFTTEEHNRLLQLLRNASS